MPSPNTFSKCRVESVVYWSLSSQLKVDAVAFLMCARDVVPACKDDTRLQQHRIPAQSKILNTKIKLFDTDYVYGK